MKGLLLKDLYMGARYLRSYVLMVVIFLGTSLVDDNIFFIFYPCILSSMVPINLLGYDERSKWDAYCGALPCSKAQIVSGKYLIGLLCQCTVLLLTLAAQLLRMQLSGGILWEELQILLATMMILCFFSASIPLPLIFRLGVEKGRMVYYVMVGLACGGSFVAADLVKQEVISAGPPIWAFAAVGLVLYGLSWLLSIRWYEKRVIC